MSKYKLKKEYKRLFTNKKTKIILKEMAAESQELINSINQDPQYKLIAVNEKNSGGSYIFKVPFDFDIKDLNTNKNNIEYLMFVEKGSAKRINKEIDSKINTSTFTVAKKDVTNVQNIIALAYNKILKDEIRKSLIVRPSYDNPITLYTIIVKMSESGLGPRYRDFNNYLIQLLNRHVKSEIENDKFKVSLSKIIKDAEGHVEIKLSFARHDDKILVNNSDSSSLNDIIKKISKKIIETNVISKESDILVSPDNPDLTKLQQLQTIIDEYSSVDADFVLNKYLNADGKFTVNDQIRISPSGINQVIEILNNQDSEFIKDLRALPSKGGSQGQAKGKGEAAIHILFNTSNVCTNEEPDAIIVKSNYEKLKCSVKQFDKGVQTGSNIPENINNALKMFSNSIFKNQPDKITKVEMQEALKELKNNSEKEIIKDLKDLDPNEIARSFRLFKNEICKEHDAEFLIGFRKDKYYYHNTNRSDLYDFVLIASIPKSKRISFRVLESKDLVKTFDSEVGEYTSGLETLLGEFISLLVEYKKEEEVKRAAEEDKKAVGVNVNDSYKPKGKVLKEVYSNLFKKKLIREGGLGGHMRHPYENLDITPREMMNRIESYGVPKTVIDKVDGQNLFFTVERDGTLLFARNKQDMTHQDLVDKFTGHGAESAFLEGGEAIKSGVEQWLSSAGNFAEQEILDIFHPTKDIRSFINFEIMHPKKSNQIQYDKKYIVFHSIVDFGEGRSQIFSSNQDERLKKLIGLMNSGVSSTGFELASNREIDLNVLTNVQITTYKDRIKDLIDKLEMDEDEFLADGILKVIDKELAQEGINLEENTLKIMRDFVLYGEDSAGDAITSRDFTKHVSKEDAAKLRKLGLTNATKAKAKVAKILSPFKEIFVDLGIDLLKGIKSAYLSPEKSDENIEMLRDKLRTAIKDYDQYMMSTSKDDLSKVALRLEPHVSKIKQVGIDKAVSTSVEGGVYTHDLDLEKITGGFAPLNQIVGAAYRDKEGIFPNFQKKFLKENKKYSLKSVFNLND